MGINYLAWAALAAAVVFILLLLYWKKKGMDFGLRTILALGLGIVLGLLFKGNMDYVAVIGKVYVKLISAVVIPLLFFSIIASIVSLGNLKSIKTLGGKSVGWLVFNTVTASVLALMFGAATKLGKGYVMEEIADYTAKEVPPFMDAILDLVPGNIVAQAADGKVVPIILFALLIGVAFVSMKEKEPETMQIFEKFIVAAEKIIFEAVGYIIELTPIAVLALIANSVSKTSLEKMLPLGLVLILVYLLSAIQIFVVDGALIKFVGKLNPVTYFKKIWPALVVAFTSQSSVGTLPVTVSSLKKLGVSEQVASFTAGLGTNLGMPACAGIWPILLAIFTINALNIPYEPMQYVFLVLIAVMVSVGTVGVPGTATITTAALFAAAGLPIEVIVIMAPISSIADMARTACNVAAAATSAVLVDRK